ncbi:MAG: biotin-dependent carboxyltransferase family protein [Sphingobacteriaceae bacterium]|nr:MAG: biotin-dependent carboxyltransferase family protein [Sphingobacteriaceae bacterium]
MRIRIIKPGVLSTVQDLGRRLHADKAVPVSGAMDTVSARMANIAVGNDDNCAVLELTYAGAVFFAETDVLIAWSGEGSALVVNNVFLPKNKPVFIPAGNYIEQKGTGKGCRIYLAIAGGWDVPEVLGSRSTYLPAAFGGVKGRTLQVGDVLSSQNYAVIAAGILRELTGGEVRYTNWQIAPAYFYQDGIKEIYVIPGHEFNRFNGASVIAFFTEAYTVSNDSNRMGINLAGPVLTKHNDAEILSTAVTPGTIQVTNSAQPVLLMADGQTTGGYPRIAQVAAASLPTCGQLVPGDKVLFKQITWHEAETMLTALEDHLHKARLAISHKYRY